MEIAVRNVNLDNMGKVKAVSLQHMDSAVPQTVRIEAKI